MIVAQPHSGVNPTTIYERKGPGQYGAKISVCIISLLNDFMQQYPKLIQLYDIGRLDHVLLSIKEWDDL